MHHMALVLGFDLVGIGINGRKQGSGNVDA
jgi:hypothetical protein